MGKQPFHQVTIVVPVYGDWSSLKECIQSLKQCVGGNTHRVMLVNDCGPDAELMESNIKKAIRGFSNFSYYRNKKNLGFVKTCNRAVLELEKSNNDILLLNSDTKVTGGFLEEMLEVLYATPKIGTVSPRSNNATLATVPLSAAKQKGIAPKESYQIFLKLKEHLPRYTIVPVAHGFCMLIRRDVINRYGLFDPIFGLGYGEEVDFCMRIKKHGYLSALSNRSYVFHLEARSFTLARKKKLLEENNKIINERYPQYSKRIIPNYFQRALINEEAAYPTKHLVNKPDPKEVLKRLVKSNRVVYKIAKKVRHLNRKFVGLKS